MSSVLSRLLVIYVLISSLASAATLAASNQTSSDCVLTVYLSVAEMLQHTTVCSESNNSAESVEQCSALVE